MGVEALKAYSKNGMKKISVLKTDQHTILHHIQQTHLDMAAHLLGDKRQTGKNQSMLIQVI